MTLAQKVRDFFADFIEKIKNALKDISIRNAEYRALQNEQKAQEKILAMFDECLKASQKSDTNDIQREIRYSIKYPKYTNEQLKNNAKSVVNMETVVSLKGNEFDGDDQLSNKIDKYFSSLNNNIYSDEYGDVLLNKSSRHSDLRHGSTRLKNTAYVAIPDVIKNGKTIFVSSKKGVERIVVAAPIEISNEKYYMGVMLMRDSNTQRLYLHDVITKKETELISGVSLNTTEANETENNLFMTSILQKALSVNSYDMQNKPKFSLKEDSEGNKLSEQQQEYFKNSKIRDENGNLQVVYHGTESDFTVFDSSKTRANMDIQGNFFSPWEIDAQGYGANVGAYYLNITNPAPEGAAYKSLYLFKGENNAGIKARNYLISQGYDGVNNGNEEYIAFYPEQIKKIDNINPTNNSDIRYSRKEPYSYETLTSKPDMKITTVDDTKFKTDNVSRSTVINNGLKSALSVGFQNSEGDIFVNVEDIDKNIKVTNAAFKHSFDRRYKTVAPVYENIGNILKNSIMINELNPRNTEAKNNSYVLVGIGNNTRNNLYIVEFVVNNKTNALENIDVLYSINAKKETAALNEPESVSKNDTSRTVSNISISDLLDYVNRYYPDILPEDVLKHYGYDSRPNGNLGESALYSLKEQPIDYNAVLEENEELSSMNEDLKKMLEITSSQNEKLKNQFKITDRHNISNNAVDKVAVWS